MHETVCSAAVQASGGTVKWLYSEKFAAVTVTREDQHICYRFYIYGIFIVYVHPLCRDPTGVTVSR